MKGKDYSTLRLESEHEDVSDHMDREGEERRLARRRCITMVAIASLFVISTVILTLSVVHDVKARANDPEWEEFSCQQSDPDCLDLLCPEGMAWDMVAGKCKEMAGYTCCTACTHEYKCFQAGDDPLVRCCHAEGVVPAAYKQVCREGYLWVQWKKKCLRKEK